MEGLSSYTRIYNKAKCDHKTQLIPFLTKQVNKNPNGNLPIFVCKFNNKEIISDAISFLEFAI